MKFTESMLDNYSQPLSKTEDQLCKNAIAMVVGALKPLGFQEKRSIVEPMYPETYAYFQELESQDSDCSPIEHPVSLAIRRLSS